MNIPECSLDFRTGMNIIQGKVGEGKSAIFAALAYALSDYKRGDSWKNYIKTGQKFFEINIDYQFPNDTPGNYMHLYLKGNASSSSVTRELTYNGEVRKGEEVTQFLNDKLDQQMLNAVIFSLQGGQTLSQTSPAERRDIFKKIFNSDFSSVVAQIKADKAEIQSKIDKLNTEISVLKNKQYNFFRLIAIDESENTKLQSEMAEAQQIENVRLRIKEYDEKTALQNKYVESLTAKNMSKEVSLVELKKYESSITDLEAKVTTYDSELSELDVKLKELEATIAQNSENNPEVVKKPLLEQYNKDIDTINKDIIKFDTTISINKQYLDVMKLGNCPKCGQVCEPSHSEEYQNNINQASSQKDSLVTKKKEVEALIAEIKASITEFNDYKYKLAKELSELNSKITIKKSSKLQVIDNINRIKTVDIPKTETRIAEIDKEISEINESIYNLDYYLINNKRPVITGSCRDVSDIQKDIDNYISKVEGNKQKEILNEKLKVEREEDLKTIDNKSVEVNNLSQEIDLLDKVSVIYNADFPNFINMKACAIIESFMNAFFSTTKDRFKVAIQLDKKGINFYYKSSEDDADEFRPISMASGFESALLTLAFKLSVASSFGSDMVILDEPDGPADEETAEKLYDTLAEVSGFNQIFIISHKKDVVANLVYNRGATGYKVTKGVFSKLEDI